VCRRRSPRPRFWNFPGVPLLPFGFRRKPLSRTEHPPGCVMISLAFVRTAPPGRLFPLPVGMGRLFNFLLVISAVLFDLRHFWLKNFLVTFRDVRPLRVDPPLVASVITCFACWSGNVLLLSSRRPLFDGFKCRVFSQNAPRAIHRWPPFPAAWTR